MNEQSITETGQGPRRTMRIRRRRKAVGGILTGRADNEILSENLDDQKSGDSAKPKAKSPKEMHWQDLDQPPRKVDTPDTGNETYISDIVEAAGRPEVLEPENNAKTAGGMDTAPDDRTVFLSKQVSQWFVRHKNQFFLVEKITSPLTQTDVKCICVQRFKLRFSDIELT